jgi:putative ABC transport system substrate-binding protein
MAVEILVNGASPATMAVETLADGIITVNTETADALGIDISVFQGLGSEVVETTTAKEFE